MIWEQVVENQTGWKNSTNEATGVLLYNNVFMYDTNLANYNGLYIQENIEYEEQPQNQTGWKIAD